MSCAMHHQVRLFPSQTNSKHVGGGNLTHGMQLNLSLKDRGHYTLPCFISLEGSRRIGARNANGCGRFRERLAMGFTPIGELHDDK